ncbi:pleiotropic drug resistance-like protein, putative [Medicago truncatula]|uniref:Pleiotropic drug resistance-like protein, putative n=1 Tax=Medicago truncatula TaxID=3880 RepID=G7J9Q7_MEDTR|nr:pleiotropic drug resistance-like protein, putative [Medicago truncatula]
MFFLARPIFFFQNYPKNIPGYIIRNAANPSIPTSGLDARVAAIVMRTVRNTGGIVVCTIHQPTLLCREINTPTPGSKDLFFRTKYSQPFFMQFKACF